MSKLIYLSKKINPFLLTFNFQNNSISPSFFFLVSCIYSPQEVDIRTSNTLCVLKTFLPKCLEILPSKVIVRYRERVFLPDAIHSRNLKAIFSSCKSFICCILTRRNRNLKFNVHKSSSLYWCIKQYCESPSQLLLV